MMSANYPNNHNQDNSWIGPMFLWYIIICAFVIIGLLSLTSCGTGKHLPTDQTTIKDSTTVDYRDSSSVRDSLVYVPVPVEASKNVLPEFVPSHLETSLAESDAWVDSLGLHHTLANKKTVIPVHVPVTTRIVYSVTSQSQEKARILTKYVEVEKPLSWWQSLKIGAFWWLCGALALCLLWVFRKPIAALLKIV